MMVMLMAAGRGRQPGQVFQRRSGNGRRRGWISHFSGRCGGKRQCRASCGSESFPQLGGFGPAALLEERSVTFSTHRFRVRPVSDHLRPGAAKRLNMRRARISMSCFPRIEMSGPAVHWLPEIGGQNATGREAEHGQTGHRQGARHPWRHRAQAHPGRSRANTSPRRPAGPSPVHPRARGWSTRCSPWLRDNHRIISSTRNCSAWR